MTTIKAIIRALFNASFVLALITALYCAKEFNRYVDTVIQIMETAQ